MFEDISRKTLNNIKPYVPGKSIEQVVKEHGVTDAVKMASNENPLGPAVKLEEMRSVFDKIYYYPHFDQDTPVIQKLATKYDVSPERIILGNGSDEIFQFLVMSFLNPGEEVISSEHTYAEYPMVTAFMNGIYKAVPLKDGYRHDLDGILASVTDKTKIIFLASPNNPTGTIINHIELESFLKKLRSNVIVVMDEAYGEYVQSKDFHNTVLLIQKFPNLVMMRTFSKIYGLAGIRVGYAVSSREVISIMYKVKQPFNVHSMGLKAAELALDYQWHVEKSINMVNEGKKYLYSELDKMDLCYLHTEANFICIFLPVAAREIYKEMLGQGVIIRNLESFGLIDAIRVTIGLKKHNERFIEALANSLRRV
ncbi:MAG: histidinol-phosphate transaminase [bacterium]|nr:histidinol-phosphate transaminase [bacterium]